MSDSAPIDAASFPPSRKARGGAGGEYRRESGSLGESPDSLQAHAQHDGPNSRDLSPPAPPRPAGEGGRESVSEIFRLLANVPDPEIPAVSVVDLGIVRDVEWRGDDLVVTVTPTYSGCPATAVIAFDIENALRARGFARVRIETRLAPPWTTDWISDQGRARLKAFGIAPPSMACAGTLNAPSECPHCGSTMTERISQFGSTPCKAQYRCADCREPFDHFKRF